MPNVYFNTEVGSCESQGHAQKCVLQTAETLKRLDQHVETCLQGEECGMKSLTLYLNNAIPKYFSDLWPILEGKNKELARYVLQKFGSGKYVVDIPEASWIVEGLGVPSDIIEYVANENGMLLTFASHSVWEKDFMTFVDRSGKVPNIWGQEDVSCFDDWLKDWYENKKQYYERIVHSYNVIFCDERIKKQFSPSQWHDIADSIKAAFDVGFRRTRELVEIWENNLYYIRRGNHSNFTIRIFFEHYKDTILIGTIYHKTTDSNRKERDAAIRAQNVIKAYKSKNQCKK